MDAAPLDPRAPLDPLGRQDHPGRRPKDRDGRADQARWDPEASPEAPTPYRSRLS